ncbi:MAG: putative methyltransferase/cg2084 [Nocardioides sp.]|jgi:tRNA/tmRNA/rRNA uracil-C5-methylase (TrmA/RlmC/RlmD family)|uniref:class I SAM-dependent RNA methyltransferase n=1 Tax=Nocardioides sp. TaxID=35761 RepID=UPI002619C151|nr:methyltransferase [Nocardioides sp.]MCW2835367.1 putative methyltransferase/cg2084 [Nocardioides sp.]
MNRRPRPRKERGDSRVGQRFEAVVGPVAHGGHCIVRLPAPESRVVFTRHVLPGERVILEITEGTDGDRFWRGDAVSVLDPSPDRVAAPCPFSGPGLCGGCDFQHVTVSGQRALKAAVVSEQLSRLAGLELDVEVEEVPGDEEGLRWRTRMQWATTADGLRGLRAHRSRRVVPVDDCLIAQVSAREPTPGPVIAENVLGVDFLVEPDGFWQVHPGAPSVLVSTVLSLLSPQPGERVLDLYAGVGLFARFIADAVGTGARVVAIEGDRPASQHAVENLSTHEGAVVECGSVDRVLAAAYDEIFDLVVLDPPREGAKRAVVEQVVARAPRAVAYVACDPAALARDVAIFAEHGYRLETLRAFDLFPMTHHVECVALLTKSGSDLR